MDEYLSDLNLECSIHQFMLSSLAVPFNFTIALYNAMVSELVFVLMMMIKLGHRVQRK